MAIYLMRNGNTDNNHSTTNDEYFKKGYIYKLIRVIRYSDMPASLLIVTRGDSGFSAPLFADINCFDYVREIGHD